MQDTDMPTGPENVKSVTEATAPFFPVSATKLALLSFCSVGIYEVYWFYKNWVLVKERERSDIRPFWRALFAVIFCFPLFKRIDDKITAEDSRAAFFDPGIMAILYIALNLSWRLPDPFWLISLFTLLPLLSVQAVVVRLNARVAPDADRNAKVGIANIATILIGAAVVALAVADALSPE